MTVLKRWRDLHYQKLVKTEFFISFQSVPGSWECQIHIYIYICYSWLSWIKMSWKYEEHFKIPLARFCFILFLLQIKYLPLLDCPTKKQASLVQPPLNLKAKWRILASSWNEHFYKPINFKLLIFIKVVRIIARKNSKFYLKIEKDHKTIITKKKTLQLK